MNKVSFANNLQSDYFALVQYLTYHFPILIIIYHKKYETVWTDKKMKLLESMTA